MREHAAVPASPRRTARVVVERAERMIVEPDYSDAIGRQPATRIARFRVPRTNCAMTTTAGPMPAIGRPIVQRATVCFRQKGLGKNTWVSVKGVSVCAEDGSFASKKTIHSADSALIVSIGTTLKISLVPRDMSASRAKTTEKGPRGARAV